MKFGMTKIAAGIALTLIATGAHAVPVTGMTLADTIDSNTSAAPGTFTPDQFGGGSAATGYTAGSDGAGTDGLVGAFRFSPINTDTYASSDLFFGNNGGGVINLAGSAPLQFTSGFDFSGGNFQPYNNGPIAGNINDTGWLINDGVNHNAAGDLTFSAFNWAGFFTSANFVFNLPPDAGTFVVNNLYKTAANTYAYRVSWSHVVTAADDPSGTYQDFNARWVIEGNLTAVPEASTYGMMVAGLGLVGMAVRRRRSNTI